MSHSHEPQTDGLAPGDFDDPEPGMTWLVTFASAIVLTALVLGISAMYFGMSERWREELVAAVPAAEYERVRQAQLSILAMPRKFEIVDADGNAQPRIGIPITEAMEALVASGKLGTDGQRQ